MTHCGETGNLLLLLSVEKETLLCPTLTSGPVREEKKKNPTKKKTHDCDASRARFCDVKEKGNRARRAQEAVVTTTGSRPP